MSIVLISLAGVCAGYLLAEMGYVDWWPIIPPEQRRKEIRRASVEEICRELDDLDRKDSGRG